MVVPQELNILHIYEHNFKAYYLWTRMCYHAPQQIIPALLLKIFSTMWMLIWYVMPLARRCIFDFGWRLLFCTHISSVIRTYIYLTAYVGVLVRHAHAGMSFGWLHVASLILEGYMKLNFGKKIIKIKEETRNNIFGRPFVPLSWMFANRCGRRANPHTRTREILKFVVRVAFKSWI